MSEVRHGIGCCVFEVQVSEFVWQYIGETFVDIGLRIEDTRVEMSTDKVLEFIPPRDGTYRIVARYGPWTCMLSAPFQCEKDKRVKIGPPPTEEES